MADMSDATWRKSSYSSANNDCVELARTPAVAGVRDSKNPGGRPLALPPRVLAAFLTDVKAGRYGG